MPNPPNQLNLKNPVLAFFPEEVIELNREILHHPDLQKKLETQAANEIEIRIACIAAHCNIAVDGYYTPEELLKICKLCLDRLRVRRKAIIGPSSTIILPK